METQKPKPNNENELVQNVSEIPLKRDERNDVNVSEEVFRLKRDGLSYQEIADQLGLSKSRVSRILKAQPIPKQANTVLESDLSDDIPDMPNTFIAEPPELMDDTELKTEKIRLKREMELKRMRARSAWLDYIRQNPSAYLSTMQNDGHGTTREREDIRELKEQIKELARAIQNPNPLQWAKLGVDAWTSGFNAAPKGSGRDPIELVMAGNQLRESVEKNVQSQYSHGVEKNMIDLKLAEMAQLERVENKKIDLTEKRHDEAIEERNQIYGIAKEVIKGPVETVIRTLGGAAADKIRGHGEPPQLQDIVCPSCGKSFPIVSGSKTIVCPACRAVMGLTQPPKAEAEQPPPQPNPIPQTEAQEPEPLAKPIPQEQPSQETPQAVQGTPGA